MHPTSAAGQFPGTPLGSGVGGLRITAEQWDTFIGIIREALEERAVAEAEQRDFLTLFER